MSQSSSQLRIQRLNDMSVNKAMGFSDKGPWTTNLDGKYIQSDDFTHDVILRIGGDFESDEQRRAYAQGLADILNKHNEG